MHQVRVHYIVCGVNNMKIERLNKNQIRCTLTKDDLESRHIKLSELAYGSDKTKSLFQDMMQQAADDFDFQADDIPLMIEAIPLSSESIILIISKVESPEELDTRFSSFTQQNGEITGELEDVPEDTETIPEEITDFVNQLKNAQRDIHKHAEESENCGTEKIRIFSFRDLEQIMELAGRLNSVYRESNSIYKEEQSGTYYFVMHQGNMKDPDFNRVFHLTAEYLEPIKSSVGREAYFREHFKTIVSDTAIANLSQI